MLAVPDSPPNKAVLFSTASLTRRRGPFARPQQAEPVSRHAGKRLAQLGKATRWRRLDPRNHGSSDDCASGSYSVAILVKIADA